MSKLAVIYKSKHHGNTRFLLENLAKKIPIDLYNLESLEKHDFSEYKAVGFASGIYAWRLDKALYSFLDSDLKLPKKTFVIYTSGLESQKLARDFTKFLESKGHEVLAVFGCKGHDSFGPLKLFGGINKDRPNTLDVEAAERFIREEILKAI